MSFPSQSSQVMMEHSSHFIDGELRLREVKPKVMEPGNGYLDSNPDPYGPKGASLPLSP